MFGLQMQRCKLTSHFKEETLEFARKRVGIQDSSGSDLRRAASTTCGEIVRWTYGNWATVVCSVERTTIWVLFRTADPGILEEQAIVHGDCGELGRAA